MNKPNSLDRSPERRIARMPIVFADRRKTMRDVKIQIISGLIISIVLGISIGMWIAAQIVGQIG